LRIPRGRRIRKWQLESGNKLESDSQQIEWVNCLVDTTQCQDSESETDELQCSDELKEWIECLMDDTPVPKPFVLFPKLPIELRLKIWSYAARVPPVVELEQREISSFGKP
jgi:hypothetical protein